MARDLTYDALDTLRAAQGEGLTVEDMLVRHVVGLGAAPSGTIEFVSYSAGWPARPTATTVVWTSTDRAATTPAAATGTDLVILPPPVEYVEFALSDESTALTTGTAKLTWRAPAAITLTAVRASLSTASSSGLVTVDINDGGITIMTTNKLSIDANEKTSTTAATAATLTDTAIADDAEVTFDIDAAGTGAKGLKVKIFFYRT